MNTVFKMDDPDVPAGPDTGGPNGPSGPGANPGPHRGKHLMIGKLVDRCPKKAREICDRDLRLKFVNLAEAPDNRDFRAVRPDTALLLQKLGLMMCVASPQEARKYNLFSDYKKIQTGTRLRTLRTPTTKAVVLDAKGVPLPELEDPQWGLRTSGALDSEFTGKGVRVCVIDTGLDILHPDLLKVDSKRRRSFVGDSTVMSPKCGHGTRCAGIVGGKVPAATGRRYSVAPDAELFVAKVLGDDGISLEAIIAAIGWAVENDCAIVSMSLGDEFPTTPHNVDPFDAVELAASAALEAGTLIVAGAGNDSMRPGLIQPVDHPANCKSIKAVGAIDHTMNVATYSNGRVVTGKAKVDIAAPGISRSASYPDQYTTASGTSIATPFVAGVAALYREAYPDMKWEDLWQLMCDRAKKYPGHVAELGAGLVQAPRKSDRAPFKPVSAYKA